MSYLLFKAAQSKDSIYVEGNEIQFFRPYPQDQRYTELRLQGVSIVVSDSMKEVRKKLDNDGYTFADDEAEKTPAPF